MSMLSYKGYQGSVIFSDEDSVFHGKILAISDRITYEGESVESIRISFQEAVDDYLDVCALLGKEPEKVYKGSFNVRIAPVLHKHLAVYAAANGKTLNSTVEEAISRFLVMSQEKD